MKKKELIVVAVIALVAAGAGVTYFQMQSGGLSADVMMDSYPDYESEPPFESDPSDSEQDPMNGMTGGPVQDPFENLPQDPGNLGANFPNDCDSVFTSGDGTFDDTAYVDHKACNPLSKGVKVSADATKYGRTTDSVNTYNKAEEAARLELQAMSCVVDGPDVEGSAMTHSDSACTQPTVTCTEITSTVRCQKTNSVSQTGGEYITAECEVSCKCTTMFEDSTLQDRIEVATTALENSLTTDCENAAGTIAGDCSVEVDQSCTNGDASVIASDFDSQKSEVSNPDRTKIDGIINCMDIRHCKGR